MAPGFHGLHRVLDAAERGHHDHRHLRVLAADQRQQLAGRPCWAACRSVSTRSARSTSFEPFLGGAGLVHVETGGEPVAARSRGAACLRLRRPECVSSCGVGVSERSIGSSTRKTLPLPGSLSTVILPPCSSTILETMASPSPTPLGLVVKNGLKMRVQVLGLDARSRGRSPRSRRCPPAARVFTVTAPPGGLACAAFSTRL